jgi:ubiquinone/menaquinone biosynthesis C-methylase UbiE
MSKGFDTQYDKNAHEFHEFYLNQEAHLSTDAFFVVFTNEVSSDIKNKNILDLGCGAGDDSSFYSAKGFTYHGLDASKEMCDLAKQNKNVTEVRNESFSNKISYEKNQFGLVISKYAIQTTENIAPIYNEVFRVLDNDGYFIFLVVHPFR